MLRKYRCPNGSCRWLHNAVNILKIVDLYASSGCMVSKVIIALKSCHGKEFSTVHPVFVIAALVLQNFIKKHTQKECTAM